MEALCLAEDLDSAQADPQWEKSNKIRGPITPKTLDKRIGRETKELKRIPQGIICFLCGQPGHIARDCFSSSLNYLLATEMRGEQKGGRIAIQEQSQTEMMDCSLGEAMGVMTQKKPTVMVEVAGR